MTKIHSPEQLLDVAARIFAERGYESTRLEDIAHELGVLQGSLYYHIESKAGLYRKVRERRFLAITEEIEQISSSDGTARERFQRATLAHLRQLVQYLPETDNWFVSPSDPKRTPEQAASDRRMTRRYREAWKSILRSGIEFGEVSEHLDLSLVVLSYLGTLNWVSRWYADGGPNSIEQIAARQSALFWDGVAPRADAIGHD